MQLLNMLLTLIIQMPKPIQISKKHNHYTQTTFLHHKKLPTNLKQFLLLERKDLVKNSIPDLRPKHSEWNQKNLQEWKDNHATNSSALYIHFYKNFPIPSTFKFTESLLLSMQEMAIHILSKVWTSTEMPLWDSRRKTDISREIKCSTISFANKLL